MSGITTQYKDLLHQAIINADIVRIFDYLLTIAVELGSSDIHIEPFENFCRMRVRIDGILEELVQYPTNLHESIISKFKIESGQMRPDEKRLPQDARVSTITQTNKEIDLRASTLPTVWGEKLVMRIVDKSKAMPALEELGLEGQNKSIVFRKIHEPNGIILTTGPTGSGKTSTLYAALTKINAVDVNITTFEDPVENKITGLSQSQIRSDINFTFASGLRSVLRQDPDIIMVGEIRDKETLEMAMEAAMTGHLVFSTVHTNSAAETMTRMLNLGSKPYMIAGTVELIMAQRLVRRICTSCKESVSLANTALHQQAVQAFKSIDPERLAQELKHRGISQAQRDTFLEQGFCFQGSGTASGEKPGENPGENRKQASSVCPVCHGTGTKGRIGLFEVMEYTDNIKNLLIQGKTAYEIERYALHKGMINLERDAILKVVSGDISLEEVYRIVKHKVL